MGSLTEFRRKINDYEYAEYKSGPKFRNRDTLFAKITPCLENGKTAQVDILEDDEVAFGSTEFIVLRATKYTDPDFVYYLSISPTFRKRAINCMEGTSGRKRVNENTLKHSDLLFPDIQTQMSISKVLKILDNKIELNNQINVELEAMAKLLYDYWFVQFEFPTPVGSASGVSGKPYKSSGGKMVYNKKLKREIPEGWEVKRLGKIAETGSGGTPKSTKKYFYENGIIPWINSGELNEPFIVNAKNFITEEGLKNSSAKLFPSSIILMAMYGATAGGTSIISFEATTNQAICAIIPENPVHLYFLKFSLDDLYKYLVNLSSGSARDNLSQEKIKNLYLFVPSQNILKEYHSMTNELFIKIKNNLLQNKHLTSLRDWLLPMLMNGQVSVEEGYEIVEGELDWVAESTEV